MKFTIVSVSLVILTGALSAYGRTRCEICEKGFCDDYRNNYCNIDLDSLKASIPDDDVISRFYADYGKNAVEMPLVYSGYMSVRPYKPEIAPYSFEMSASDYVQELSSDSVPSTGGLTREELKALSEMPVWLTVSLRAERNIRNLRYLYMLSHPKAIAYASWDVPPPPTLPEDDYSYINFLKNLDLPEVDLEAAILPEFEQRRRNWLHLFSTGLHVSQAYVSSNWYQGGNSYLSLLFNLNWDVALNTVYHPNLMFNSALSYKLAISTNPKGSLHKYSISQDQLQYNLKAGFRAWQKWFYSVLVQFKTQFFNAYPADSNDLTASFLSPADLNLGLGMTYSTTGRNNTLKFAASISPISYNMKACMSDRIDKAQFNIAPGKYTHSEIGSNAELTLDWAITSNISWKSRLFLFTDYSYFLADWENTFNFNINKFLSTQLYVYPRFDSSSDFNSSKWHHWMLKEILSLGVTYTFSTKP